MGCQQLPGQSGARCYRAAKGGPGEGSRSRLTALPKIAKGFHPQSVRLSAVGQVKWHHGVAQRGFTISLSFAMKSRGLRDDAKC